MMLRSFTVVAALAVATSAAFAQTPAPAMHHDAAPLKNIKVFPKDMTSEQIHEIMRKWTGDLGVGCGYCHSKDASTGRTDFASDANPIKERARVMLRMNMAINQEYLTQLADPKPGHDVGCGTCHRGEAKPSVFTPPPAPPRPAAPPPAATPGL